MGDKINKSSACDGSRIVEAQKSTPGPWPANHGCPRLRWRYGIQGGGKVC